MVSATILALVFAIPLLASAEVACDQSDKQCVSAAEENTSGLSMIQAVTLTSKKALVANEETSMAAGLIDLSRRMTQPGGALTLTTQGWKQRVGFSLVSWLIYVALALLIWNVCYPAPPLPVADPQDVECPKFTFTSGHFQCLQDPDVFLCACFCPGLRWADTMNLVHLLTMTVALSIVFAAALLNGIICGATLVGPVTLVLGLYYRHKLREVFELDAFTFGTCAVDAVYLLCCPWCAIAQEARAVHHGLKKGTLK